MAKTCTWTFRFKHNGHWMYQTECGLLLYFQQYSKYCPHCGKIIQREGRKDVNNTV